MVCSLRRKKIVPIFIYIYSFMFVYIGPFPFESNPALSSLSGNFSKKIEESLEEKKPSAVIQQFSDGILRETEPTTS